MNVRAVDSSDFDVPIWQVKYRRDDESLALYTGGRQLSHRNLVLGVGRAFVMPLVALLLIFVSQGTNQVAADHIVPPTEQVTYELAFSTSGQSMWGPGTEASPGDVELEVLRKSDFSWDQSYSYGDFDTVEFAGEDYGTYGLGVEAGSKGAVGVTGYFSTDSGSVAIDAPISVTLDIPIAESYRPGDVISIGSDMPVLGSGASISASTPSATVGIKGDLELKTYADGEICVGTCGTFDLIDSIDTSGTYDLAATTSGSASIPFPLTLSGVSGDYRIPESNISSSVESGSIVGSGSDPSYLHLEFDLDTWYTRLAGLGPWGIAVPDFGQGISGGYEIVDIDMDLDMSQTQDLIFTPGDVEIALQFPDPVNYAVFDSSDNFVSSGFSSVVTFIAGQRVELIATDTEMNVAPSFTLLDNEFENKTETIYDTAFSTKALQFDLELDEITIIEDAWPTLHWHDEWDWEDLWDEWHDCTGIGEFRVCATYHVHGGWTGGNHTHWHDLEFGGADVHEGPESVGYLPLTRSVDTDLYDKDRAPWTMQGFSSVSADAFTLNPNHAPVAIPTGTPNVDEGSIASFDGSGSYDLDFGALTYEWNFGDGSATGSGVSPNHIYGDDGPYTVTLMANDGHDDGLGAGHAITVNNLPPTVEAGLNATVSEGELYSLDPAGFNDPGTMDTHTASIDWGDGTSSPGIVVEAPFGPPGISAGLSGTVGGSHVYADDGDYSVKVTVIDDDGGLGFDTLTVSVENAAPTVEAGSNQEALEGETISLDPAIFNDLGTADTHTATIDWGDGSVPDVGTVSEFPNIAPGSTDGLDGDVDASHVYADNGIYTVTVEVTDDNGGIGNDSFTVTVGNQPPTIDAGADISVAEGGVFSLDPATFNDPGTADTHTATIDWGDESAVEVGLVTETPIISPGSTSGLDGTIGGSHVYADNGIYVVTVEVTDKDGESHSDSVEVTVTNVDPTLTPSGEDEVIIFDPFTIESAFSDPGFDCPGCLGPAPVPGPLAALLLSGGTLEKFTITIDWGDGTLNYAGGVGYVPGSPGTSTTGLVGAVHYYDWIGTYYVVVTLTDDDGGTDSFTHEVEVLGGHELNVEARRILSPFEGVSKDLDKALEELDDVIDGDYWAGGKFWVDEVHLQSKHGKNVFSDQKKTVDKLMKILSDDEKGKGKKFVPLSPEAVAAINEAIYLIIVSDQVLAQVAIEEAESTPVFDPKKQSKVDKELEKAREELVKAQAELEKGHMGHAVDQYKKAWEHAGHAIKHASPKKIHSRHGDPNDG